MRKLTKYVLVAFLTLLPWAGQGLSSAQAADGWAVDFDLTYNGKYVWRGLRAVDDPVLQPSMNIAKYGLTLNIWGNYNLTDVNGDDQKRKFTELDFTADYTFTLGKFSFPVGVIHYIFPNTSANPTTEIYAGVSYDWIITPKLVIYKDVQDAHGVYGNLSLGFKHDLPSLSKDFSLGVKAGASLGYGNADYNKYYFGVDEAHFTDLSATVGLPIGLGKYFTLTPAVTYSRLVDSAIKDSRTYSDSTFAGLSLSVSF